MNPLYWAAVAAGLLYGALVARPPSPVRALVKTLPVALLAAAAWLAETPAFLVAALVLSALGDFCLAFRGERFFLAGLAAFLLAHLAYVRLFFAEQDPLWTAGPAFLAATVAVVALAVGVFRLLRPRLGALRWPVAAYTGAIAAMAIAALARGPDPLLLAGVALFFASDMALAFETFPADGKAAAPRWRGHFIWYAYFCGQALIAAAFLLA
ncbi:MAG: hypothetical protein BroJett030_24220 [Alphaproteobacteria bacterium]|nr:MAG: hypothetical protein BroJett030_24220 [Alphaproteobacteria bacterium]